MVIQILELIVTLLKLQIQLNKFKNKFIIFDSNDNINVNK